VDGLADVANGSTSLEDAIDQGITAVVESLDKSLPDMVDRGVKIVTSVADGIANNLPKILDAAGKIVAKVLEGIIAVLPTLLKAAVQIIASLASYIIQSIPNLAEAALQVVLGIVKFLIENGPQILQAGIELVGKLVAGLIQAIPKVVDGVRQIIQRIKSTFSDIDWGEVGRRIIEGIKNGLAYAGGMIVDAARDAARNALNAAKNFLGINSPSRVFKEQVGEMIPAGMAEGIEDGAPEVESSMDKLLRGFTADVDYNLPNLSDYAQDLGESVSASANMQITVPVTLDGREIARATAWYTNEQLAWEARG
jgi:phage-related protein